MHLFFLFIYLYLNNVKEACFASLKRRGNRTRQGPVEAFLRLQIQDDTILRRWAQWRSASHKHAYWYSTDIVASRRLIRLLMGQGPHEECIRRRPYSVAIDKTLSSERRTILPRLDIRTQRVCYLCGQAGDANNHTWQAETTEHMLFFCLHHGMTILRDRIKIALLELASASDTQSLTSHTTLAGQPAHHLNNETVLFTVFMMCESIGQPSLLQPALFGGVPNFFSTQHARVGAEWVSALLSDWSSKVRSSQTVSNADQSPGGRLVSIVVQWAMDLFLIHRRAIRDNAEYQQRLRDPPEMRRNRLSPKYSPTQRRAMLLLRKKRARQRRIKGPAARALAVKRLTENRLARFSKAQTGKKKPDTHSVSLPTVHGLLSQPASASNGSIIGVPVHASWFSPSSNDGQAMTLPTLLVPRQHLSGLTSTISHQAMTTLFGNMVDASSDKEA